MAPTPKTWGDAHATVDDLHRMTNTDPRWRSDGDPMTDAAQAEAHRALNEMEAAGSPIPWIGPEARGGVCFEWGKGVRFTCDEFGFEIGPDGRIVYDFAFEDPS